jgi:uncharacterized damage-inducible protein DinB
VNEALVELFKHKTWATLLVIEALQGVDADVLDLTTPGTYGTIRDTLQHLVAADASYLTTITGKQPAHPLPDEQVPLETLADRIRELGPRWDDLARDPEAPSREVTTGDGWRTPAAIPIAQAIHHAECHRGHVLSVIGAHGIELPGLDIGEDLDVWHHGIAVGLMQETGRAARN